MALVRTSTSARVRASCVAQSEPVPPRDALGTRQESLNPHSTTVFFSSDFECLNSYIVPAISLAKAGGLFDNFDGWTRAAVQAVVDTNDPASKKILWIALLSLVPDMQAWLCNNAPPLHQRWTASLLDRVTRFATGAVLIAPSSSKPTSVANDKKRASRSQKLDANKVSSALLYSGTEDFLYSEVALYLACV
jgi:hypothetical protein